MNKLIHTLSALLLLAGLLATTSCREDMPAHTPSLSLSQTDMIQLPSTSGQTTITVTSSTGEWVALSDAEWVQTSQSGNTLTINVTQNPSTDSRKANVQVCSGGITKTLIVEQGGSPLEFNAQKNIEFGQFGGEKRFYVEASSPKWEVSSSADWVTVTPYTAQGEIAIKVGENTSREGRTAQVQIKDSMGKLVHSVDVNQSPILYLVMPYPEFGVSSEVLRFFETDRYSRLVNQPDFSVNFFNWGYETVSPIFNYIIYAVKNGKYVGATVYSTNRNPENLQGAQGEVVFAHLQANGYRKVEDGLYFNEDKNAEATVVTTTFNPNITFVAYPPQAPAPTFDKLPLGLSKFYVAKFHPQEDDDPIIEVIKEGLSADEIIAYETKQGWKLIPPYDPTAPENRNDSPAEQERKRDESSRKVREPLFFGAKRANPNHWREFYKYLVFENNGQYRAYEMAYTFEEYINNYVDQDDPMYGSKSRRVSGTALSTTRQSFEDPSKFFYWDEASATLYVTKEFRFLLAKAGFLYSSTIDSGRAFIYYNPKTELELMFRIGKTLVDGDSKNSVVVVQLAPRL